jgi:hypothetical protein
MDDKKLNNIWNQLTADNKTESDFETWKNNIATKENVQDNVHSYLVQNGFVESDLGTWKNNVGLKKKDSSESNGEMEVTESITEQVQEENGSSGSSSGEEDIMLVGETIDPPKKQEQPPQKTSRFDPMSVEPITAPETEQQFEAPTIPEEQFESLDYVKKVKDYDQSLIDNNIYENKDQIRDMRYEMASGFLGESDKREYELLQKIKKVDEKIEIYKDPESSKFLPNSEKALSDAIKEKEGYEQSLTKIKEQYLNENQEAIKKARFELSKDPENKQLKENLLKLQSKYKSFFKPIEAAKEIYVSTPEMQKQEGETPYEKFLNYYDAAVLEYDEARDAMRASDMVLSTIPLIDDISGASPVIRRYVRAYKKLEALTPIALLNRKALKEDNFFSQLGKSALSTFSDASLSTTEQEESSIVFDVLQKADVGKNVSEENIKALESSFDMTTGEKAGSMLGATIAMMPAFIQGGAAVRGLKNITKLGRAFDKLKDTNRFSKFLLGAVEQGVSYEAAQFFGDEAVQDEASFLSGALGETFSKGLSAIGKRNVYMQIMLKAFGNNASKASKFLAIAAQRTGTGLGEMAEEYGNELGNIINESDGDLKKVKDLWVERFGKLDQNLEFGLSTFGMGVLFGSATKAGQQFADTYKDWLSGQTDDVKAKFGEIEKEINQDAQKIVNEVAEDVAEEVAPEVETDPEVEEKVTEESAPDLKIQEERKQKINPEETVAYEDIEKSINEGLEVAEKLSKSENPEIAESNKKDIKDIKDNKEDITSQDIIDTITSDEFIDEYGDWQKAKEQYDNLPTNEKTKENRLKILSENNVTVMTDKNMMPKVMFHGTKASREQLKDGIRGGSYISESMSFAQGYGRVLKGFVKVGKITDGLDNKTEFDEGSNYIELEGAGIVKDGSQFKEIKKPLKTEVKVELEQAKTPGEQITTTEEQTLFKGMQPKKKDGKPFSVHKVKKGSFAAVDEKLASDYKGDQPLKKFTVPPGTTVDVVQVEDTNQPVSEVRRQEEKLIDDSDAQVVKLITRDARGVVEEQYIIKDDAILETSADVDETQEFIDEEAKRLEDLIKSEDPQFQLAEEGTADERKDKLKEKAIETFSNLDEQEESEEAFEIEEPDVSPKPVDFKENKSLVEKVKGFKLKDIIGKKLNLLMADKLKVQLEDPSKPYNKKTNKYKKMGGSFFPLMDGMFGKVAWASIKEQAANRIIRGAMNGDASVVYNMGDGGIYSNIETANALDEKIPQEKKAEIWNLVKDHISKSTDKNVKNAKKHLEKSNDTLSFFKLLQENEGVKTRAAAMQSILAEDLEMDAGTEVSKELQNLGISLKTLVDENSEQFIKDQPVGTMTTVLEITNKDGVKVSDLKKELDAKLDRKEINKKQYDQGIKDIIESAKISREQQIEEGLDTHNNYPIYIRGRAIGVMEESVPYYSVTDKYFSELEERSLGLDRKRTGDVKRDATESESNVYNKIKEAKRKTDDKSLKPKERKNAIDNIVKTLLKGDVKKLKDKDRKKVSDALKQILKTKSLTATRTLIEESLGPLSELTDFTRSEAIGYAGQSAMVTTSTAYEITEKVATAYEKFVNRLTKAFPSVGVSTTQEEFDALVNDLNAKKLSTKNQKIYGAIYNGKLYLNPAFENFNTPLHEFGHIWLNVVKKLKPLLYNKGMDLIQSKEGKAYVDAVKQSSDYKRVTDQMRKNGATDEQINTYIYEEALATAIGDKGESFVKASAERKGFKEFLKDLFQNVKKLMGISKYTAEQLEDVTLDEFVQAVSVDLLSGEKLFEENVDAFNDALQLMTAPDGDSMYDIIRYGRSKDIPDAAIRKVLIDRKFKAKDIDAALEINLDIFTKIPVEFQTVADGAKSAVKLFQEVKKELDKFINKNKKASVTKVREQGIKILKSNPIFKKQNALVKMQLIDGFNRSINLKEGNFTFQKKINNLRKSIRDRVKGTKDLAKVIQEMKRMALSNVSTLQLSKDERKVLNDIIKSIGSLNMVNVKIETEKILNAIQKKRASDKVKTIKSIKKLIKDSSTRKAKIGKDAKSFFKSAKDIFQTLTSGDQIKIDALAAAINENQYLNDQIQEKVDKEEKLTPKEIKIYNDFLAYKMFNNIDNMTLEEVIEVYNGLKSDKKEGIQVLKDIQSIESKKRLEEEAEAVNQIKETNPELFDDKGNLLDDNQIEAKRREIYQKFKQLKIPEAISDYVKLFKYGGYTYMIRSLKNNLMNNLETLTNIADRTTKGFNLFRKKIYDKLNVMNTNRLAGLQAMEKKLNSIVDNIGAKYKSKTGVTLKGYKAIQVIAQRKGSMKIDGIVSSLGGKSIGTFGPSELMTIYAYWKNENVKKKLEKQGFTQDKIDAIEKHLGKELTAFADSIVDFLSNEYYDGINEVYSEVNYNNLGAIENYFPLTTLSTEKDSKKYSELTKDGNFSQAFNTETAPYWKARTDKETDVDLTDIDFFTKLDRYINTMEGYKAYAKGAKELQSFFEIPAVKTLLKNLYIDNAIRAFVLKQLSPNSLGVDAYKGFAPFRGLLSNMTRVVLGFKTIQIAKQAISFIQAFPKYDYFGENYKGKVPSIIRRRADLMMFLIDAARMYASLGKDLIGKDGVIAEALEASPDFKDRWTQALKGDVYSLESGTGIRLRGGRRKFTRADRGAAKLAAIQGAPTTIGDVLGVLGYMVNYKRNIANGMNKSDALRILNDYNSTQQTRRETERTQLQGSKNPLVRTFLMFGSAIFAQQNKLAQSTRNIYRSIFSSQIPRTEDVRSFVINGFLVNILFEMTANIFKLIKGDDEDLKEVMDSLKEIMLFTKQLYAVPLIGSTLEELDLGGKAIAYLDDEFYEKPKFRSQDVVNPFNVIYRRTVKNADSDRGFLFNAARPAAEALVGFNVDPFIGTYNYFSADKMDFMEQEEEMMNILGVTPSYQPNRLRQEVRDKEYTDFVKQQEAEEQKFIDKLGDVKAPTGAKGRSGTKREGRDTRNKRR